MTPAECDLRDYPYMPLDVLRLRDSEMAGADPVAFKAAVLLWCASWHQVPAASLPDDEAQLARLAGYGRDVRNWRRARERGALHGWTLCADGRLYHGVVAAKAREAWATKQAWRQRTAEARAAKQAARMARHGVGGGETGEQNGVHPASTSPPPGVDPASTPPPPRVDPYREDGQPPEKPQNDPSVTHDSKGEGKGEERDRSTKSPSEPSPAPTSGASLQEGASDKYELGDRDPKQAAWADGVEIIRGLTGKSEDACRRFLGALAKAVDDNFVLMHEVLVAASRERPIDPGSWLKGAVKRRLDGARSRIGWVHQHARDLAGQAAGAPPGPPGPPGPMPPAWTGQGPTIEGSVG